MEATTLRNLIQPQHRLRVKKSKHSPAGVLGSVCGAVGCWERLHAARSRCPAPRGSAGTRGGGGTAARLGWAEVLEVLQSRAAGGGCAEGAQRGDARRRGTQRRAHKRCDPALAASSAAQPVPVTGTLSLAGPGLRSQPLRSAHEPPVRGRDKAQALCCARRPRCRAGTRPTRAAVGDGAGAGPCAGGTCAARGGQSAAGPPGPLSVKQPHVWNRNPRPLPAGCPALSTRNAVISSSPCS